MTTTAILLIIVLLLHSLYTLSLRERIMQMEKTNAHLREMFKSSNTAREQAIEELRRYREDEQ